MILSLHEYCSFVNSVKNYIVTHSDTTFPSFFFFFWQECYSKEVFNYNVCERMFMKTIMPGLAEITQLYN